MDLKQNQHINRGDYFKIDKNSTNVKMSFKLLSALESRINGERGEVGKLPKIK